MLTLFTLTPSHTFLLRFPLDFDSSLIARTLSLSLSHFFAARLYIHLEEQLSGKSFIFISLT